MNNLLPYEQECVKQLNNLPLPSEDFAWDEMKKMLEEKEDDSLLVPFIPKWGCAVWGLLLMAIIAGAGWFFFYRQANGTGKIKKMVPVNTATTRTKDSAVFQNNLVSDSIYDHSKNKIRDGQTETNIKTPALQQASSPDSSVVKKDKNFYLNKNIRIRKSVKGKNKVSIFQGSLHADNKPGKKIIINTGKKQKIKIINAATENETDTNDEDPLLIKPGMQKSSPSGDSSLKNSKMPDTIAVGKKKMADNTAQQIKSEEEKKTKYYFTAGLSVYHPFRIKGESAVPFNYYGRKGSITDYIPAVYFRVYRKEKWFIHSGFRYGAPQYIKEFVYKQKVIDSSITNFTRSNYTLKKTYYHQAPLSFNVFIKSGFSAGAGIIYNKFSGAISGVDIVKRIAGIDSLISSGIVNDKNDSSFTRNNMQWLLETQYQWRRFSAGARYAADFSPYIKYTNSITGELIKKKSTSLNVFIRYEIWSGKKK